MCSNQGDVGFNAMATLSFQALELMSPTLQPEVAMADMDGMPFMPEADGLGASPTREVSKESASRQSYLSLGDHDVSPKELSARQPNRRLHEVNSALLGEFLEASPHLRAISRQSTVDDFHGQGSVCK